MLVLWLAALLLAVRGSPLQPNQVYRVADPSIITVLAPGVALKNDNALAMVVAPTLEACAAACRANPQCTEFESCDNDDGCTHQQPHLRHEDCRLMASNCTLVPGVEAAGPWISRISGFPVRHTPVELPEFTTAPAQVLEGGDFDCSGSVLPGRCAFDSVLSAASVCSTMPTCRSVLHFHNGTDGCSDPVAVLTTSWPTESNSFVAPTVDVLTKNTDGMMTTLLMASDGRVLEPTEAELAAAANVSDPSTAWLGCIVAEGALMDGALVGVQDGVATAEACCRACRANATCNVWNYCGRAGGCSYAASSPVAGSLTVNLTRGQCELRFQEIVASGWPPIMLAKGSDVPLTAGAPLAVAAPDLPGYVALPGRLTFDAGSFECAESARPELKQCAVVGQLQQLAEKCDANLECLAFAVQPEPGPPSQLRTGILKSAFNSSQLALSPTALVYVHQSALETGVRQRSSSLSGGAIAGIVVGSCAAAAAALAGAAWLALRRRQRRRRPLGGRGDVEGGKEPAAGSASGGSPTDSSAHTSGTLGGAAGDGSKPGQPGSGSRPGSQANLGSRPGSQANLGSAAASGQPCRRASWNPSHTPSPFAAQAAAPFASAAASSAGATELPSPACGSVALPIGANSRRLTSSSHNPPVLPIAAAEAEAATTAAAAAAGGGSSAAGSSGHGSSGPSPSSNEQPLPELAQHVAQCDAARSTGLCKASSLAQELASISIETLPASLRASVVDVSQIRYLTGPSGELQEIGKGASGTVYRALYLNEIVAAKEIDIGRSQAMQEAFVNEALRLHELHHPHVVALLGVTIAGSTGILLMEYCAGRDLRSALGLTAAGSNERLFGWYRKGRRVIQEVAKALNFLHARGVVHMDVKANNVLLTAGGTAKLADVGLSRLQTGTYLSDVPLIGTFAWIAPEVLVGSQQCSSAVDIFSLGVVMWEVITGERPQRGSLRSPRVPEECPQEAADLMMECLSLEPSQRPTASQLMRRLDGGRGGLEATSVGVPLRPTGSATQISSLELRSP